MNEWMRKQRIHRKTKERMKGREKKNAQIRKNKIYEIYLLGNVRSGQCRGCQFCSCLTCYGTLLNAREDKEWTSNKNATATQSYLYLGK